MEAIYHERQQGQLCAQHCLNNLLQGPFLTAVDLAGYAEELDEAERLRMVEGGVNSPAYLRFMGQPSTNMDDSGFFSGQVISLALSMWSLDMDTLSSARMQSTVDDLTELSAFICNHNYHWLTVRKLGKQWFNLDSLLLRPQLISDTYLNLFLRQLQMEGYTIFVVLGPLPSCEADQLLTLLPVPPEEAAAASQALRSRRGDRGSGKKKKNKSPEPLKASSSSYPKRPRTSPPGFEEGWSSPDSEAAAQGEEEGGGEEEDDYALDLATAMSVSLADQHKEEGILGRVVASEMATKREEEEFEATMAASLWETKEQDVIAIDDHRELNQLNPTSTEEQGTALKGDSSSSRDSIGDSYGNDNEPPSSDEVTEMVSSSAASTGVVQTSDDVLLSQRAAMAGDSTAGSPPPPSGSKEEPVRTELPQAELRQRRLKYFGELKESV